VYDAGPEDVVRRFLEVESRFESQAELTVGRLHAIGSVEDDFNFGVDLTLQQGVANIRSLRLREESADRAIVDVDAFVVHDVKTRHGASTGDFRVRGPVELLRGEAGWKVATIVVDGIDVPAGLYEPFFEEHTAGCAVTVFARPAKRGAYVLARVVNETRRPVNVTELELSIPLARVFGLTWGSSQCPALVEPGATWVGMASFAPLSRRKQVSARLIVDGEQVSLRFVPSATRHWSRRARLRRIDSTNAMLAVFLVFGIGNAAATNWVGLGFLGIGLAIAGARGVGLGVIFDLAGFRSSGSLALALSGAVALVAGSGIMQTHGLGWIGTFGVVGTVLFAMYRGFAAAHGVRRRRARVERVAVTVR
jgi:hypothetical protein